MSKTMKNKAVFLDRDGVINEIIYHKEMGIIDSPFTVEQFQLLPKVAEAINIFHNLGFKVIVISNQPGLAKDNFSIDVFDRSYNAFRQEWGWSALTSDIIEGITFAVDNGADVINMSFGGNDFIAGSEGADTLEGLGGDDIIFGKAGSDNISGGAGSGRGPGDLRQY